MKVRAIRGVCTGPERHLAAGQVADLEPQLANYLRNIGAVEPVPEAAEEIPQPVAPQPARKEK
ncbi:MAG: hypothetical protein MUF08_13215 [Burkholderiaceae bacterium]|jgi:hypothetical protein|nr:hypothetical protein [Burkholderiaceae bacterium]MCU0965979.1 hypothetical protein [Burkholderiaceae bacterium]